MAATEYYPEKITEENKTPILNAQIGEEQLPFSIYDVKVSSADGKNKDILSGLKGKVTLIFNVAAGCGNIPQHSVLEELHQKYKDVDDFNVLAIVVDDFICHGYPEFQDGLDKYIEREGLDTTPSMVAKDYAEKNFGTTFEFSELTNGRYDKHTYDPNYVPGSVKIQEQHELWKYLTGSYKADIGENGLPIQIEDIPWSYAQCDTDVDPSAKTYSPVRGNFEKFLIDKTGTKVKRFANGFLLGERDQFGIIFPWVSEKYKADGRRDHAPVLEGGMDPTIVSVGEKNWPNNYQRVGIDISLEAISKEIDYYLSQ